MHQVGFPYTDVSSYFQRTDSSEFVCWNSQKCTEHRIITLHGHFWSIEGHLWRRRDLEISCTSNTRSLWRHYPDGQPCINLYLGTAS